jgi:hypothetical protein
MVSLMIPLGGRGYTRLQHALTPPDSIYEGGDTRAPAVPPRGGAARAVPLPSPPRTALQRQANSAPRKRFLGRRSQPGSPPTLGLSLGAGRALAGGRRREVSCKGGTLSTREKT